MSRVSSASSPSRSANAASSASAPKANGFCHYTATYTKEYYTKGSDGACARPAIIQTIKDNSGDLFGHGTACGSIILGLAPEVDLVSVRVLGADLKGKGAAFLAGLEWATERGVQVANLSLSSKSETLFPYFHDVVDRAYFSNVHLVSAANNVTGASYPSLFSSVYSVAAHAVPDPWHVLYNPKPPVEFGAWGVDVPIAWKDGGSTVATGNSFAAPHVAGFVARILGKHPGLTPFEVKAVLAAIANNPTRDASAG